MCNLYKPHVELTAFEVYDVSMGYAEIQTTAKAGSKRHGLSPEVNLRLERATQSEFTDSGRDSSRPVP